MFFLSSCRIYSGTEKPTLAGGVRARAARKSGHRGEIEASEATGGAVAPARLPGKRERNQSR